MGADSFGAKSKKVFLVAYFVSGLHCSSQATDYSYSYLSQQEEGKNSTWLEYVDVYVFACKQSVCFVAMLHGEVSCKETKESNGIGKLSADIA